MRLCLLIALACSCTTTQHLASCVPGTTIACACTDGHVATQFCVAADRGYLPCECDGPPDLSVPDDLAPRPDLRRSHVYPDLALLPDLKMVDLSKPELSSTD